MSDQDSKSFQPDIETVEEFLERFKIQKYPQISPLKDSEEADQKKKAAILANTLPVNVLTDIHRKLKPVTLSSATYQQIETQLIALYSTKNPLLELLWHFYLVGNNLQRQLWVMVLP